MKTIFITSFEGVEIKNLLRTAIVPTILASERVRVVLFAHDQNRVAYHKKEFSDKRISYEVVAMPRVRGLDKIFQRLKFTLLKTDTTDIRRRMKYETDKNAIAYIAGLAANRILARKSVRKIFRFLDFHLMRNKDYDAYFERYRPSLVVLANLFDESEANLLREASRRGVKSIGFINSWDKVTARCILRVLPDHIIVFNAIVKRELIRYDHVRPDSVFIGGMPQYDHYATRTPLSRDEYFKKIELSPDMRLLLYAPVGKAYGNSDWAMIDFLHGLNEAGKFGDRVAMLVRFPPNDFVDKRELEKRPWLLYDHPGFRFSDTRGTDWDMDFEDLKHLGDTLAHISLLVGYASSIAIDAAVFDKPIISINFEIEKNLPPLRSPTKYQKMVHCQTLSKSGALHFVRNEDELVTWVRKYLDDPSIDREGRKRLVREQCVFTDGKSGERIAAYILSHVNK